MKAYEIFQQISPELARAIFQYLRDGQREVYTASISTLATNKKLRPVIIQRKSVVEQITWLVKNISTRANTDVAGHVLQLWLLKAHKSLLTEFLDGLGIEHDGDGAADDIPDDFDPAKTKATVARLLEQHDPEVVRVYLHIFQLQKTGGWTELAEVIEATPELHFGTSQPAAAAPPADDAAKN